MIAENLDSLRAVYCPCMEDKEAEVDEDAWGKSTITYLVRNRHRVYSQIRAAAKAMRRTNVQQFDQDDIYGMVLEYFLKCGDYDVGYTNEHGELVSFEGYIMSGIRNCIKRFFTVENRGEVSLSERYGKDNDSEDGTELGDLLPDKTSAGEFESVEVNVGEALRDCRHLRGRFGVDLYTILYVSLRTYNNAVLKQQISVVLGCNRQVMSRFYAEASKDDSDLNTLMKAIAHAANEQGIQDVLKQIREYLPDAARVDAALNIRPV